MIRDAVFLALSWLRSTPLRTLVLTFGLALALGLPVFVQQAAHQLEDALLERAERSPVLLGREGNEYDLVMNALYFRGRLRNPAPAALLERAQEAGYGVVVPVHVRHSAHGIPVVGTGPEYYAERGLTLAEGRLPALLGEVVAGAGVAAERGVATGDFLRSDLTDLYDLAAAGALGLEVVGVLAPADSPDDAVLITSLQTAWTLDGALHGHAAVGDDTASGKVEASPGIFLFETIDASNRDQFHLHGSTEALPVGAVLVFPRDRAAHDILLGDFALDAEYQAVRPRDVVGTILDIVLRLRDAMTFGLALLVVSTLALSGVILLLGLRLRAPELSLMRRIGAAPGTLTAVVTTEVVLVLGAAGLLAFVLVRAGLSFVEAML